MELVAQFYGKTVEGDFETSNDNFELSRLLDKIKISHYTECKKIFKEHAKKFGILNPEYEKVKHDLFLSFMYDEYTNEKEMKEYAKEEAIKLGYKEPIYSSSGDSYETPEFIALITYFEDTAISYSNVRTKVEIFKK